MTTFNDLFIDSVPIAMDESLGEKWNKGPLENSRWHPEGACLRFRFSLSSGSYATTLLREFMQCPLNQIVIKVIPLIVLQFRQRLLWQTSTTRIRLLNLDRHSSPHELERT